MIFLVAGSFLMLAAVIAWQAYSAGLERAQFASERREWVKERHELNTRLQHPEIVPTPVFNEPDIAGEPTTEIQTPESDDIDLVGTIQTFDGSGD